jgi:hypothetical protein
VLIATLNYITKKEMNQKNTKKLLEDYPVMFRDHTLPMTQTCMCWLFECGDGWYDLIYDTCNKIKNLVGDDFRFVQVKEKFGGLEMYFDGGDDEIYDIISKANEKSFKICEECGTKGKLREDSGHWFVTMCNKCWEKRKLKHKCLN